MQSVKEYVKATFCPDEETAAFYAPRYPELGYQRKGDVVGPHKRIVHGTPITPVSLLRELAGGSFCVSYQADAQLDLCMQLLSPESILILDNGAFTHWKKGHGRIDRDRFWSWANSAQQCCPLAIAVIPDVIGGSEEENWIEAAYAVRGEWSEFPERTMFIWHMDESLDQLRNAARLFSFIGMGSCAEFDVQKHPAAYLERLQQARLVLEYVHLQWNRRPYVHLMRGLGVLHKVAWADSADSSNVARNHHRTRGQNAHVARMNTRITRKVRASEKRSRPVRESSSSNFIAPTEDARLPATIRLQQPLLADDSYRDVLGSPPNAEPTSVADD